MKGYDEWLSREPEEECIHEGVECELNTGEDECPCNCTQCENPEIDE